MTNIIFNFSKSKLLILLILLWSSLAFGGSPEATPSPECKAALGLVNLAFMDVTSASGKLDRAMKKTGEAIEAQGRTQKSFGKAMENHREALGEALDKGEALSPGKPFPSDGWLNRAQVELEQAQEHERSVDSRVQQVQRALDDRLATAKSRCEVNP